MTGMWFRRSASRPQLYRRLLYRPVPGGDHAGVTKTPGDLEHDRRLAEQIRCRAADHGWNAVDMAEQTSMSYEAWHKIWRGDRGVTLRTAKAAADALGVSVYRLRAEAGVLTEQEMEYERRRDRLEDVIWAERDLSEGNRRALLTTLRAMRQAESRDG